jgi:hypothetical protein
MPFLKRKKKFFCPFFSLKTTVSNYLRYIYIAMAWATLPKEMLSMIFSDLTCNDLTSAVCVNSTWNSLADSDHIWKVRAIKAVIAL